ncbi:hypothetical protein VTJ49DRAFT_395 [Mycothermus thermophilus]|uniref:Nnf1-domain-containing protein n=1 Tax=Humicola insolens TaxID=85995 RepID=A0ABR3VPG1_HUMIN
MAPGRDPAPAKPPPQQHQPDADVDMVNQPAPPSQPQQPQSVPSQRPSSKPRQQQQQQQPAKQQNQPDQLRQPANTSSDPASAPEQQQQQPPEPIIPGPRASRLQKLFATTAKHTLDKISRDNFAACFPTVAHRAPGTLEFVQRQMVERLGGLWNREFESILQSRQVVARLNELEALVADATRRRVEARGGEAPVAPHTLPAPTVLHAHLTPHLTAHAGELTARLRQTQAANAALWDEIRAQRAEVEALLSAVEKAVRDLEGANALLAEVADEVAAESREADAEVERVRAAMAMAAATAAVGESESRSSGS